MTLPSWDFMQLEDRVRMVATFFPTLEPEVAQQIIGKWATNEYPATYNGEQRAIADLIEMFKDASLSPQQQADEKARITRLVEEQMKCLSK
jgi:hypothetical protein